MKNNMLIFLYCLIFCFATSSLALGTINVFLWNPAEIIVSLAFFALVFVLVISATKIDV